MRPGFDPWVGKIPWRRDRLPTSVSWPGEFRGLYSPWGRKELDMTEWLSLSFLPKVICFFFFWKLSLPQTLLFLWDLLLFICFWPSCMACEILVPWPGIEPGPRQWECGVLTTGQPEKSLMGLLIMVTNVILTAESGHMTQTCTI